MRWTHITRRYTEIVRKPNTQLLIKTFLYGITTWIVVYTLLILRIHGDKNQQHDLNLVLNRRPNVKAVSMHVLFYVVI